VKAELSSAFTEYKLNVVPLTLSISLTEFDFVCENGQKNNSGAFKRKEIIFTKFRGVIIEFLGEKIFT